jgi:hypothetical protein
MIPLLFSVLLLATDTSGASASPSSDPTEQAAPVKKEKEKKICRTDPAYTGSRYKKQICLSAAEWEKRGERGLQNASQMGRSYSADHE